MATEPLHCHYYTSRAVMPPQESIMMCTVLVFLGSINLYSSHHCLFLYFRIAHFIDFYAVCVCYYKIYYQLGVK